MTRAEEEAGEEIAEEDESEGDASEFEFVVDEPLGGRSAVANGEKTFGEVAKSAGEKKSKDECAQRDLEDSGGENEDFEGHGRRQNGRDGRGQKPVALDPLTSLTGASTSALAKPDFPSLPRDVIKNNAAGNRAKRGHECVPGHAGRVLNGKMDDEQVVQDGEREDGRVEKADEKKPEASERGDRASEPGGEFVGDVRGLHGRGDCSRRKVDR